MIQRIHTYVHACVRVCTCVHMNLCTYVCVHTHVQSVPQQITFVDREVIREVPVIKEVEKIVYVDRPQGRTSRNDVVTSEVCIALSCCFIMMYEFTNVPHGMMSLLLRCISPFFNRFCDMYARTFLAG